MLVQVGLSLGVVGVSVDSSGRFGAASSLDSYVTVWDMETFGTGGCCLSAVWVALLGGCSRLTAPEVAWAMASGAGLGGTRWVSCAECALLNRASRCGWVSECRRCLPGVCRRPRQRSHARSHCLLTCPPRSPPYRHARIRTGPV